MTSGIRNLIEEVRQKQKLPDILGERCVHAIIETASCRACVDSCPQGAWLLDDDALRLNTEACDGCGLCIPACPERAIHACHELIIGQWQDSAIALCACEVAQSSHTEGVIPCIHAIGLQEILRLYNKGVTQWGVTTADCDNCARGKNTHLLERVDVLNRSLKQSGHIEIRINCLSCTQWHGLKNKLGEFTAGPQLSRRGFLTGLVSTSVRQGMELFGLFHAEQGATLPPGQLLPHSAKTVWPCLPVIDGTLCNGCDACAKLCPHQAIHLEVADGRPSYQLNPQNCTGCGICLDVCDQQAVALYGWTEQEQKECLLAHFKCTCCGNPLHVPAKRAGKPEAVCRICSQKNHNKNLYQVLN